jgi:hypothetical protein
MTTAKKTPPKGYVTIARAAEMDDVTIQAIKNRIARGTLKSIKIGKLRYVPVRSLLYYRRTHVHRAIPPKGFVYRSYRMPLWMAEALKEYARVHETDASAVVRDAVDALLTSRWPEYAFRSIEHRKNG